MRGPMMPILVTTSLLTAVSLVTGAWVLIQFLLVVLAVALTNQAMTNRERLTADLQRLLDLRQA
ncbi:exported hypothetical protein [uncultured Mycobacterium sp.]|uniref:Uncharacterized protein n=1 Tax=uncultured Mycobacterium sp. TaxID=171292 RepID=A0A1Y5PBZ2_9MYCO|nr:exported hypothetical protein [uncultured Mycobacterium sp.]